MKQWIQALRLPFMWIGMALIFYGERYLDGQSSRWWVIGAGAVLMLGAMAIACVSKLRAAFDGEKQSWHQIICWQTLNIVGFAFYFAYRKVLGTAVTPETTGAKALLALWSSCIVVSILWSFGAEWAFRANGRGALAEPKRVARSGHSWLLVGLLLGSLTCLNYVAVKKNKSWDWSYLKTSKPSESTATMLASLDKELQVGVFFSSTNEVLENVRSYIDSLPKTAKVKIDYFDADINPSAAESYKATKNGQIILKYDTANERIDLGTTLTGARKTLRAMDAEFQKSLLAATEKRKNLYFTRGHGELEWTGSDNDSMRSIKLLEGYLRGQNFNMRFFGVGEGSTKKVPDDADAVVVMGGNAPFLSEEVAALDEYVNRGGSVFAMLDLDPPADSAISKNIRDAAHDPLVKWLSDHGMTYVPTPLANDANYVAASHSEADTWFLFTNGFTSHESITSLARNDQRAAVLTFRSGFFKFNPDAEKDWQILETVRSLSDTFADENRDFKFSAGKEKRQTYVQGAVSQRKDGPGVTKKGKILGFADASAAADVLVRNQGNLMYITEGLRWLVGDTKKSGGVAATEEDVRIRHTRKEDLAWFYGTVLFVPALVLGIGAIANRRAKRVRT